MPPHSGILESLSIIKPRHSHLHRVRLYPWDALRQAHYLWLADQTVYAERLVPMVIGICAGIHGIMAHIPGSKKPVLRQRLHSPRFAYRIPFIHWLQPFLDSQPGAARCVYICRPAFCDHLAHEKREQTNKHHPVHLVFSLGGSASFSSIANGRSAYSIVYIQQSIYC